MPFFSLSRRAHRSVRPRSRGLGRHLPVPPKVILWTTALYSVPLALIGVVWWANRRSSHHASLLAWIASVVLVLWIPVQHVLGPRWKDQVGQNGMAD